MSLTQQWMEEQGRMYSKVSLLLMPAVEWNFVTRHHT